MKLTIIIPAHNEERKIEKDILLADEFFSANDIQGEIIVVDDGSSDATFHMAATAREKIENSLIILKNNYNYGKGFSVKRGMLEASGNYIAYCDAGATVPFKNLLNGIKLLEENKCDIAHGSRMLSGSIIRISQKKDRKLTSSVVRFLARKFLGVPDSLTDTQCGFKIYKNNVAKKIFSELKTNGFMFEVENILRAIKLGYNIKEFPVEWSCDRDSRITFLETTWTVLREILQIKLMRID